MQWCGECFFSLLRCSRIVLKNFNVTTDWKTLRAHVATERLMSLRHLHPVGERLQLKNTLALQWSAQCQRGGASCSLCVKHSEKALHLYSVVLLSARWPLMRHVGSWSLNLWHQPALCLLNTYVIFIRLSNSISLLSRAAGPLMLSWQWPGNTCIKASFESKSVLTGETSLPPSCPPPPASLLKLHYVVMKWTLSDARTAGAAPPCASVLLSPPRSLRPPALDSSHPPTRYASELPVFHHEYIYIYKAY